MWMRTRKLKRVSTLLLGLSIACVGACSGAFAAAPVAEGWREQVRAFAAEHFKNPAWGYSHSERDYNLARSLAAADHVSLDDDVLFAAAFMHDLAAFPPWADAKVDHADRGADSVGVILQGVGFPMQKLSAVQSAIRTHMYQRSPVGPEALYLHDADALDWLGAIGAARILALIDPNGGKPTGRDAVSMLKTNLKEVPPRVLSPAGRMLVPRRQAELADFLEELGAETSNFETL